MWNEFNKHLFEMRQVVDVKQLSGGCLVQITKCTDCANTPVIKDICNHA